MWVQEPKAALHKLLFLGNSSLIAISLHCLLHMAHNCFWSVPSLTLCFWYSVSLDLGTVPGQISFLK